MVSHGESPDSVADGKDLWVFLIGKEPKPREYRYEAGEGA